jgi:arginase
MTDPVSSPGRDVEVIGVPLDLGQDERGTDVGPAAIRYAELHSRLRTEGHHVFDDGNIAVPPAVAVNDDDRVQVIAEVAEELCQRCLAAYAHKRFPLILGGDHSIAIGSVAASARQGRTGLLWVDAHGDLNTPETSPSGNIHGMPLAVVLGTGHSDLVNVGGADCKLPASNVVLLGIRQLDPGERRAINAVGIKVLSIRDIDERGMRSVAAEAIETLSHCDQVHLSLDMDSLDPTDAPGVGTPVRGGLTYREVQFLMEELADTRRLCSMDVVEVNPMLDVRNQTAGTAVDLILSALGQSII